MVRFFQFVSLVISFIYIVFYFKGGTAPAKDAKRAATTKTGSFYSILALLMGIIGALILLTQILTCFGIILSPLSVQYPFLVYSGTLLFAFGICSAFIIRMRILGKYWSGAIEIKNDHQIKDTGIYAYIRHPLYMVTTFIYIGLSFSFPYWWNFLFATMMLVGYIIITILEDEYLKTNLPAYQEYCRKVRYRWIPGIW